MIYDSDESDGKLIETLVLSAGGMHGIYFLGALEEVWNKHSPNNIHTYIGCSVGGLIAFLLIIGYTPKDLIGLLLHVNLPKYMLSFNFGILFSQYGIDNGNKLLNILNILAKAKDIPINITFQELQQKTNKKLIVACTRLETNTCIYLDYENYPDVGVIEGIMGSCSIPLLFTPRYIKNIGTVLDGAVKDFFPIHLCDSKCNVLGIIMNNWEDIDCNDNMLAALVRCFSSIGLQDITNYIDRTIQITIDKDISASMLNNMDNKQLHDMIVRGKEAAAYYYWCKENINYNIEDLDNHKDI